MTRPERGERFHPEECMDDHIIFDEKSGVLDILDQRFLPGKRLRLQCRNVADVIGAIKTLAVRGAPAIGVAAAYGCAMAAAEADNLSGLMELWKNLENARPTAVNLSWAVERMRRRLAQADRGGDLQKILVQEARAIHAEDAANCRAIGHYGARLLDDGDCVLTHCNAGALATGGYGTALGVIRAAWEGGKKISVLADETRPLMQGARLTAYELASLGIPVSIVCDNACAFLMGRGLIQKVVTGADRIAANGDTANKIGTCGVAIIAKRFNIPFYIAAPFSTVDFSLADGSEIPVEVRAEEEVLEINGKRMGPAGVPALNFAFDITPAELICGIITEKGVLRPPYRESLACAGEAGKNEDAAACRQ